MAMGKGKKGKKMMIQGRSVMEGMTRTGQNSATTSKPMQEKPVGGSKGKQSERGEYS